MTTCKSRKKCITWIKSHVKTSFLFVFASVVAKQTLYTWSSLNVSNLLKKKLVTCVDANVAIILLYDPPNQVVESLSLFVIPRILFVNQSNCPVHPLSTLCFCLALYFHVHCDSTSCSCPLSCIRVMTWIIYLYTCQQESCKSRRHGWKDNCSTWLLPCDFTPWHHTCLTCMVRMWLDARQGSCIHVGSHFCQDISVKEETGSVHWCTYTYNNNHVQRLVLLSSNRANNKIIGGLEGIDHEKSRGCMHWVDSSRDHGEKRLCLIICHLSFLLIGMILSCCCMVMDDERMVETYEDDVDASIQAGKSLVDLICLVIWWESTSVHFIHTSHLFCDTSVSMWRNACCMMVYHVHYQEDAFQLER